jgi:hypothetical protein
VRQLQLLIEESSLYVLGAYERKLCEPGMAYREHVLELVDDSKALYKLSHQAARNVIRVQMIDLAEPEPDLKLQDPSVRLLRAFFFNFFFLPLLLSPFFSPSSFLLLLVSLQSRNVFRMPFALKINAQHYLNQLDNHPIRAQQAAWAQYIKDYLERDTATDGVEGGFLKR